MTLLRDIIDGIFLRYWKKEEEECDYCGIVFNGSANDLKYCSLKCFLEKEDINEKLTSLENKL